MALTPLNPATPVPPLQCLCEIIQTEMGLADDQVYVYQQKINIPPDDRIYIAVGELSSKPYSNINKTVEIDGVLSEEQSTNFAVQASIDIFSRSTQALFRKEEIILALGSNYAQQIQEAQAIRIARISQAFNNLSQLEASAIPYRFQISVTVQYKVTKTKAIPYYDKFEDEVNTEA